MEPLRDVIRALRPKKKLGQNFLSDPQILSRIVNAAGPLEGRTVIEVGPGPGGLTREIIKQDARDLFLIEQDDRPIPYLEALKPEFKGNFTLIEGDALKVSIHSLGKAPRKIIANLPYNISVPLLLGWLKHMDDFESLTLMFQKEVAGRLNAVPGTKAYGRLSVMCQWKASVQKIFDVPPGAFTPAPKVTSTIVQLTPRVPREEVSWEALEAVTRAAFSQRRKMLRSSLKSVFEDPESVLESVSLSPQMRAEELTVTDFCALATRLPA